MQLSIRLVRKCRTEHRCAWCNGVIAPGETAMRRAEIFDKQFASLYYHPECWDALVDSTIGEDGFGVGEQQRGIRI